jgi:hypothetical protein
MIQANNENEPTFTPAPIRHEASKWVVAKRWNSAPVIDGQPGEGIWQQAAVLDGFVTAFNEYEASHEAEYRVAYDDDYLYISGNLARPAADTLAQIELIIRPAQEKQTYYTVKLPLATAQSPAVNTNWNPVMDNINVSTDQGRVRIQPYQYESSTTADTLYVEAAVPIASIAAGGAAEGDEWRFNIVHVHNLYTQPLDSWVAIRNTDHWHAGTATANMNGDLVGQDRLGSLFFSRVPSMSAADPSADAAWYPATAELLYTGFTEKELTISAPNAAVSAQDVGLYWKEPLGDWQPLTVNSFVYGGMAVTIRFDHPAMRKDGLYQLLVRMSPPANAHSQIALIALDKERVVEGGEASQANGGLPQPPVQSVTYSPPSSTVTRVLSLIPDQPGFIFVGLPELPELYPQSLYRLSSDGLTMTAPRTGTVYPNALYPEDKSLVVPNALGQTVSIPYHEDAEGKKYFITAHKWYLQKAYAITQTSSISKTDPLGAARLLSRFAEAYKGYNPTIDRVSGVYHTNYSQPRLSGPPYAYWGGVWQRWWYNDLEAMTPLLNAFLEVKKTNAFELLSDELGFDVEQKIVDDMIRPSADFTLSYLNRFSNMSMEPWTGLISVGKTLGDSDLIHRVVEYLQQFTTRMYLSDGFWQEVTPSYHIQTVNGLKQAVSLLNGWSDPAGYVSPRTGTRFDNLNLAEQFPVIGRALDAANRLVYPDGKVLPVMDTWAATVAPDPKPDGSMLMPGAKIGRLAGGTGPDQTHVYMGFQPKYGHTHLDPLNLSLYAGGQELMPDIGYSHNTKYRAFTLSTMSHNTVIVDSQNMVGGEASRHGGNVESFATNAGPFQAMSASYEGAYPVTEEYSREPWFIPFADGDGEQGYVLDLFRVSGGSRHEYTLQGDANRDAEFRTGMPLTDYGPYLLPPGTTVVEPETNSDFGSAEGHYPGYIYVRDVKQAQLDGDRYNVSLVTEQDGAEKMKLNITGLLEPGTNELYLGRSPSLRSIRLNGSSMDNNDEADKYDMPKLVLRRDGTNLSSTFTTVLEPYGGLVPRIEAIDRLQPDQAPAGAVAVKVAYGDTIDLMFSNPHHPDQSIVVGDIEMKGRMGLIRLINGEVNEMSLTGGTLLKKGTHVLTGEGIVSGTITDTLRKAAGDAYDAIVTNAPVSQEAIGSYVIVTHPDQSTTGFLIGDVMTVNGQTVIVLAEHDPGFEIGGDGTSKQVFYPAKQWTGNHTFHIQTVERATNLSGPGSVQPTGTVTGTVYGDGMSPIGGADVHATGYTHISSVTDATGKFALTGVPVGRQRVTVHSQTYAMTVSPPVQVTSAQPSDVAIYLSVRIPPAILGAPPIGAAVGEAVYAASTTNGYIYLVPADTPKDITAIENAVAAGGSVVQGVKAASVPNVPTMLDTGPLEAGAYMLYAIDGQRTMVSAGWPIVLVPTNATVIQDTSPLVRYDGKWTSFSNSLYSGGTMMIGQQKGAYVEIPFFGTSAKLVADLHTARGKGDIYVDGEYKTTIDTYSPTIKYQQVLFDTGPLPEGVHAIRLVSRGEKQSASSGSNISFDALLVTVNPFELGGVPAGPIAAGTTVGAVSPKNGTIYLVPSDTEATRTAIELAASGSNARSASVTANVYAALPTAGLASGWYSLYAIDNIGRPSQEAGPIAIVDVQSQTASVDEDDPVVNYTGEWRTYESPYYAGGTLVLGWAKGVYADIPFYGTGAKVISDKRANRGKAKIYVDGVYQTTIDQYNPTIIYRQNVYDTGPLPEGLHTIRVETIWERNPSATTYYVSFDELQVTLPAP